MALFRVDVTDTYDELWDNGLATLITARADVSLTVHGLATPITGTLVHLARGGHLVIDQRHDEGGTVVLVPVDRVIAVHADYQQVDREGERRARVAADTAFLDRVRELAEPLEAQVTRVGRGEIRGARAKDLRATLEQDGFEYDAASVDVALDILRERGDLPHP